MLIIFTVTAIKDGIKRVFFLFKDSGIPAYSKITEESTDESNGVEVKLAANRCDFRQWYNEIHNVLCYFDNISLFEISNAEIEIGIKEFKNNLTTYDGFDLFKDRHCNGSNLIQGNVAYSFPSMHSYDENWSHREDYYKYYFVNNNRRFINFKFNIGEIDVAPSREEVSLNDTTAENIYKKFIEVYDLLYNKLKVNLRNFYENFNMSEFDNFYKNLSNLEKTILLDIKRKEYANFSFEHKNTCIGVEDYEFSSTVSRITYYFTREEDENNNFINYVNSAKSYRTNYNIDYRRIHKDVCPPHKSDIIGFLKLTNGIKIIHHTSKRSINGEKYIFPFNHYLINETKYPEISKRFLETLAELKEKYGFTYTIINSDTFLKESAKNEKVKKEISVLYTHNESRRFETKIKIGEYTSEQPSFKNAYYMLISGTKVKFFGKEYSIKDFRTKFKHYSIFDFSENIYYVRKNSEHIIEKYNMKNLETEIKNKIKTHLKNYEKYLKNELFVSYTSPKLKKIANYLGFDSSSLIQEYPRFLESNAKLFDIEKDIENIKKEYQNSLTKEKEIMKKYPLLKYIVNDPAVSAEEMLDYVKLINQTEEK